VKVTEPTTLGAALRLMADNRHIVIGGTMTKRKRLQTGDAAPEWKLLGMDGQAVTLSSLWGNQPTLLTFLRHFG
jgi:hypothetical protein